MSREDAIPPGEAGEVKVTYTISHVGAVQQVVTARTNDPRRPVVYLTLRGHAPQSIALRPSQLAMVAAKGEQRERSVALLGPPGMTVQVTSKPSYMKTTVRKEDENADRVRWQIVVRTRAGAPVGRQTGVVELATNRADAAHLRLPVTVYVQGELQWQPRTLFFGITAVGAPLARQLTITRQGGLPFRVKRVVCADPRIVAVMDNPDAAAEHCITVTVDTDRLGLVDAKLAVETDVAGEERIQVPVTALLQDASSLEKQESTVKTTGGERSHARQ